MGPSINFPCAQGTFNQLSVLQPDLPSCFRATVRPSINVLCNCGTFCILPSTFLSAADLPLTFHTAAGPSVNFPCGAEPSSNFSQLSVRPQDLPSTLHAASGPSIKLFSPFQLPSTFHVAERASVNYLCCHWKFSPVSVLP